MTAMTAHSQHRPRSRRGFTTMELLIAISLLAIVVTMAIGGWVFVLRGERRNSAQCELDIQVRSASERLRAELRLSDATRMVFFPEGPGPYEAISFPMAVDSSGNGLIDVGENDRIAWTRTVIYHVERAEPDRLLRTVFNPRDNSLSTEEREAQLAAVVRDGSADNAANGANAVTRTVFENFFDWSIEPKLLAIDGYSPTLGRRHITFGSVVMGEASHDLRFSVLGRHPRSTGFKIGLDTLRVSSADVEYEAEDQQIVAGGFFARREYMPMGSWGGNLHLLFDTGEDQGDLTLRIPYHRWEERHFRSVGSRHTNTRSLFDGAALRYSLRLGGSGEAWNALEQTGAMQRGNQPQRDVQGHAVRALIRGADADTIGAIRHEGRLTPVEPGDDERRSRILLRIPPQVQFVPEAWIAEADPDEMAALGARTGTARRLHLRRTAADADLVVGTLAASETSLDIRRDSSYVVSFLLESSETACHLPDWSNNLDLDQPFSAVLPEAGASDLTRASWSGLEGFETITNLYALERLITDHPAVGVFQSRIVDTMHQRPRYGVVSIERDLPEGTAVEVQVRTGDDPLLADADAWEAVAWRRDGDSLDGVGEGRYVQFRARLTSDALGVHTPDVGSVAISWPGNRQIVDIGGSFTTGPDHGVFTVSMDDAPVMRGMLVRLSIQKAVSGTPSRLVSSMMFEVEPRNTGK